MKAILEFDLPEDKFEHQTAVNANKWKNVVWNMYLEYRECLKYKNLKAEPYEIVEELANNLRDQMENQGLTFND